MNVLKQSEGNRRKRYLFMQEKEKRNRQWNWEKIESERIKEWKRIFRFHLISLILVCDKATRKEMKGKSV